MKIEVNSITALPDVAKQLLQFAGDEKTFIFNGEMGAGKTTFIKCFCAELGVKEVVSSPTYSIVNEYIGSNGSIYHFDFYRIKRIEEAYDLGYEDYFYSGATLLIEWPERIEEILPDHYIKVHITIDNENNRIFNFTKI